MVRLLTRSKGSSSETSGPGNQMASNAANGTSWLEMAKNRAHEVQAPTKDVETEVRAKKKKTNNKPQPITLSSFLAESLYNDTSVGFENTHAQPSSSNAAAISQARPSEESSVSAAEDDEVVQRRRKEREAPPRPKPPSQLKRAILEHRVKLSVSAAGQPLQSTGDGSAEVGHLGAPPSADSRREGDECINGDDYVDTVECLNADECMNNVDCGVNDLSTCPVDNERTTSVSEPSVGGHGVVAKCLTNAPLLQRESNTAISSQQPPNGIDAGLTKVDDDVPRPSHSASFDSRLMAAVNAAPFQSAAERYQLLRKQVPRPVEPGCTREYVRQMLTKELDTALFDLLRELDRLQLRAKQSKATGTGRLSDQKPAGQGPAKPHRDLVPGRRTVVGTTPSASAPGTGRRRYVHGLAEARRLVRRGQVLALIVVPNIEKVPGPRGLDAAVQELLREAARCPRKPPVEAIFGLSRYKLREAINAPRNLRSVSTVAILNVDGESATQLWTRALKLARSAREQFIERVRDRLGTYAKLNSLPLEEQAGLVADLVKPVSAPKKKHTPT